MCFVLGCACTVEDVFNRMKLGRRDVIREEDAYRFIAEQAGPLKASLDALLQDLGRRELTVAELRAEVKSLRETQALFLTTLAEIRSKMGLGPSGAEVDEPTTTDKEMPLRKKGCRRRASSKRMLSTKVGTNMVARLPSANDS